MEFLRGEIQIHEALSKISATAVVGTSLEEISRQIDLYSTAYVLVVDREEQLVGVVAAQSILNRISTPAGDPEGQRWRRMSIDSIIPTNLGCSSAGFTGEPKLQEDSTLECTPLRENGELLGLLTDDDLFLSWKRIEPVLYEATVDAVTGLPNRYVFERHLQDEWNRAARLQHSIAMILVDVDHFKEVNDQCGHVVGDTMLHMVGSFLRRKLRSYDMVSRFGGDEFSAICCACRPGEIDIPIRRLVSGVEQLRVPSADGPEHVTLSIGASVIHEPWRVSSANRLVESADESLYKSKANGRACAHKQELGPRLPNEIEPIRIPREDDSVSLAPVPQGIQ